MTWLCEAAVALGLTLGGLCEPEPPAEAIDLPEDDPGVWSFQPPPPPPEPEPTIVPPPFPPVVIVREADPAPPPPPPPAPPPVAIELPEPDPMALALQATLGNRHLQGPRPMGSVQGVSLTADPSLDPLSGQLDAPDPPPATSQERYEADGRTSSLPVDNSRIVTADRFITGILETGVNSQLDSGDGGSLIIQTSRDVFGYHGRNILIPKGSRLICDYESPERLGDTRLPVQCNRVLIAGHRAEILQLASAAGDVQGRGGLSGEVDNRFWEKYGTAFVIAGISAAVRLSSAAIATGEELDNTGQALDEGAQELSERLGEITASVLEQSVDIAPIVTIAQGTRVQIRPSADWYIRKIDGEGEEG